MLSYSNGVANVPLLGRTLGEQIDISVQSWGDVTALIVSDQGIRWTYAELAAQAKRFASALVALGLTPGDRVGIWSPNNAEWIVTQYATAISGLVLVNINPAYRTSELTYAINKVGCKALITASSFKTSDYIAMLNEVAPELSTSTPGALKSKTLPTLETVIQIADGASPGTLSFNDVAAMADASSDETLANLESQLQFDDPINIQFTSGTTGQPKGATLTHHNILNNGYFIGETLRYSEVDKVCVPVPLYHCFGMVIGSLACLTHGATMVLPSEGFDPVATLRAISDEKCTSVYGVPTMFIAELDHPDFGSFDYSSLRTGVMAGSPCPIEIMRRCIDDMNLSEMTICYGMTETSPVSTQTLIGDSIEKQVSTVGQVHPHIEIKIIDTQGRVVPRGEPGELCTRGYSVMLGYWADEEKTDEVINDAGWMHTGDLATMDDEGYCNVVGRLKDMVIRGGENVYPREIEEFLYEHPAIQDVQCFGVPDEKYGEEICVWVSLRPDQHLTAEELIDHCKGKIAHFKIPRYVRFVDEFPMTVTGKIQKYLMRENMVTELGL